MVFHFDKFNSHLSDQCPASSDCKNFDSGFTCECFKGEFCHICNKSQTFEKGHNGSECEDIDECEAEDPPCPEKSDCINSAGSFECSCNRGYELVRYEFGNKCDDIDECLRIELIVNRARYEMQFLSPNHTK